MAMRSRAGGQAVFAINGDSIVGITGFPDRPELVERPGLAVSSQLDDLDERLTERPRAVL